jgi:GDP-4-dehydro-6-deoxy-D-mannose reductase
VGQKLIKNLATQPDIIKVRALEGDICDKDAVTDQILDFQPTHVVHLAAVALPQDCEREPERALAVNVTGAINVAEACLVLNKTCQLLFTSTAHVYNPDVFAKGNPVKETDDVLPQNFYAKTKLMAEDALIKRSSDKFKVLILRVFNHVHKSQPHGTFLSSIYHQAIAGKNPIIVGYLELKRDISPVSRLIYVLNKLLDCQLPNSFEIVNVAGGFPFSLRAVAETLLSALNHCNVTLKTDPTLVRIGEPDIICADIGKLMALIGSDWPKIDERKLIEGFLCDF